jgi:hypothetical protein
VVWELLFFTFGATALLGPKSPNCWNCEITHRHTKFSRTALGEWSACRYIGMASLLQAGFEPTVPASECPQTYSLVRAATGIGGLGISGTVIHEHLVVWKLEFLCAERWQLVYRKYYRYEIREGCTQYCSILATTHESWTCNNTRGICIATCYTRICSWMYMERMYECRLFRHTKWQ